MLAGGRLFKPPEASGGLPEASWSFRRGVAIAQSDSDFPSPRTRSPENWRIRVRGRLFKLPVDAGSFRWCVAIFPVEIRIPNPDIQALFGFISPDLLIS